MPSNITTSVPPLLVMHRTDAGMMSPGSDRGAGLGVPMVENDPENKG